MGSLNVESYNQNLLGGANEYYPLFKNTKRKISPSLGPLWTPPEEMEEFEKGLKKYATQPQKSNKPVDFGKNPTPEEILKQIKEWDKKFQQEQQKKYYLGCIPVTKEFYEKAMKDKRYWILC